MDSSGNRSGTPGPAPTLRTSHSSIQLSTLDRHGRCARHCADIGPSVSMHDRRMVAGHQPMTERARNTRSAPQERAAYSLSVEHVTLKTLGLELAADGSVSS